MPYTLWFSFLINYLQDSGLSVYLLWDDHNKKSKVLTETLNRNEMSLTLCLFFRVYYKHDKAIVTFMFRHGLLVCSKRQFMQITEPSMRATSMTRSCQQEQADKQ